MPNENQKIYDWLDFAQSYLHSADLLFDTMIVNNREIMVTYIPAMYLLKHGAEVFIKMTFVILNDELGGDGKIHDARKLIEKMCELISSKSEKVKNGLVKNLADEKKSASPDKGRISDLKTAIADLPKLQVNLMELKQLVLKYYYWSGHRMLDTLPMEGENI